jgi:hypothetical protein
VGWGLFNLRVFRNQKDTIRSAWNRAVKGSPKAIENISRKPPAFRREDPDLKKIDTPQRISLKDKSSSSSAPVNRGSDLVRMEQIDATERLESPMLHQVDGTVDLMESPSLQGNGGDELRQIKDFQSLRGPSIVISGTAGATHKSIHLSSYVEPQSTVESAVDGKSKYSTTKDAAFQEWRSGVRRKGEKGAGDAEGYAAAGCSLWRVVGREGVAIRAGANNSSDVLATLHEGDVLEVLEHRDDTDGWAWLRLREVWEWQVGPQTWERAGEGWVGMRTQCTGGNAESGQDCVAGDGLQSAHASALGASSHGGQSAWVEQLSHWEPGLVGLRGRGLWKVAAGGVVLMDRPDPAAKEVLLRLLCACCMCCAAAACAVSEY